VTSRGRVCALLDWIATSLALALQDWTKIENEDAEGLVEVTYRSGSEPGRPPDIQVIQKKMAIVAWQPGPNRVVAVPDEVSCRFMGYKAIFETSGSLHMATQSVSGQQGCASQCTSL